MDDVFVLRGVSEEQKETIRALFRHFDWDLNEVNPEGIVNNSVTEEVEEGPVETSVDTNTVAGNGAVEQVQEGQQQMYINSFRIEQDPEFDCGLLYIFTLD